MDAGVNPALGALRHDRWFKAQNMAPSVSSVFKQESCFSFCCLHCSYVTYFSKDVSLLEILLS